MSARAMRAWALRLMATVASVMALLPSRGDAQVNAGRQWDVRATVGRAEHRVDAGFGVGVSEGTVLGVAATLRRWQSVELDAHAWGGQLDADEVARDDRTMGEVGLRAGVPVMPWLLLVGSATVRGVDAAPAVQRWTQLGAGAELRFDFADGLLQSVVQANLLPRVTVSGAPDPDLGIGSGAALRLNHRRLQATLAYTSEHYGFPSESGEPSRREQLSALQLGVGLRW